jgi:hypothetical protein
LEQLNNETSLQLKTFRNSYGQVCKSLLFSHKDSMSLQSTKENNSKSFDDRLVAIDYLKSFTTTLVLLLNAILAYPTWGKFNQENYVRNSTAPIIDPMKWKGFDLPPTLLNLYFMALIKGIMTYSGSDLN